MIVGLLQVPPTVTPGGAVVQATRLGHALFPPKAKPSGRTSR